MTKNNNITIKIRKMSCIEREDKYEDKKDKLEARKQAQRSKSWAKYDHERY